MSVKSVLVLIIVLSILLNVATLTITGVHAALSGALSAVGVSTVAAREVTEKLGNKATRQTAKKAAREAAERTTRKKAARKISREIADGVTMRVQRQALRNSASIFGEAIPFLGVAVLAGALTMEIKDSCDTARDIAALTAALETEGQPGLARRQAEETFDCKKLIGDAIKVPSQKEIWQKMRDSPQLAWETAASVIDSLEGVDWSGKWTKAVDSVLSFGEWVVSGLSDSEVEN